MLINQSMVDKAEALIPELVTSLAEPKAVVEIVADETAFQGWRVGQAENQNWQEQVLGKGDSIVLDFEDHLVGYVSFKVKAVGSPPDAPLKLKLTLGEMPCEIAEPFESYDGWLSSSWLQEETIFIDVLPAEIKLPRRYTFRFIKIDVLDTSKKYNVSFEQVACTTVTSGDPSNIVPLPNDVPDELALMDRIAIKTLQDCMQSVFEDGPKRDRRLWIGDLRLQAQANYLTFNNFDLVKRCLFLFAGMRLPDGAVGACVFEKPHAHVDDTRLYDYALFFVASLYDYYVASEDIATLQELWPIALEQIEIAVQRLDELGIVRDDETWWSFIDWHPDLNKQAPTQGVLIYCLKRGLGLARILGQTDKQQYIEGQIERTSKAAVTELWDDKKGFFVSGAKRQISWASQIWLVLAEVLSVEENAALLNRLFEEQPAVGMTTPYMYHHLIEALFSVGSNEKAAEQMQAYWGEMIKDGADTFWELYNPDDKKLSPYGSNLINSYCHAWSCTPTYFIRKYLI